MPAVSALAIYEERVPRRPPLWNAFPSLVQHFPSFCRRFADWARGRHIRRINALHRLIGRLSRRQQEAIQRGVLLYGDHGTLISGGSRDHWPRELKDACGVPARQITLCRDALLRHEQLARRLRYREVRNER